MPLLQLPLRIAYTLIVRWPAIAAVHLHAWLETRGGGDFEPLSGWVYRVIGVVLFAAVISTLALVVVVLRAL